MPATSIRDLVIKDDDLVIGTHGRSFWILDNISPLRQISAQQISQHAILYKPPTAYRVRWNMWTDTPLPQEEPGGQNPPDGAIVDYYLNEKANAISLEILQTIRTSDVRAGSKLIRVYSNKDTLYKVGDVNIPLYWIRAQQILSAGPGHHRFVWDMKYTPLNVRPSYPISAIYKNTAPAETSPWVMPGTYTVRLTVDGKVFTREITIKMDPRVKTSVADLAKQHDLSIDCYTNRREIMKISGEIAALRSQIKIVQPKASGDLSNSLKQTDELLGKMQGAARTQEPTFAGLESSFAGLFRILQESDMPPTSQTVNAVKEAKSAYIKLFEQWNNFKSKQLHDLNTQLKASGMAALAIP